MPGEERGRAFASRVQTQHDAPRRVAQASLRAATLTALCALAAFAFTTSPAWAGEVHIFDSSFGEAPGPGQLHEPDGVALNEETGNVYVADRGDGRIEEFTATGTVLGEFGGASAPTGALEKPSQLAIDNSGNPLDPSENDVYVTGEVTIAGEAVHVIYKFSASGAYLGQIKAGSAGGSVQRIARRRGRPGRQAVGLSGKRRDRQLHKRA